MIESGKVTGREIKKNKDGLKSVVLLQVQITDPDDVQSVELMNQSGEDNNPPNGSRVTIIDIGMAYKIAVVSDDNIEPITNPGEKRVYSTDTDNSAVMASIYLKTDGAIRAENDNGYYELQPSGLILANDAQITTDGDVITKNGISLDNHTHAQPNDGNGDSEAETNKPTVP